MKNLKNNFILIILFLMNYNSIMAQAPCGFNGTPSVDDCCVTVKVIPLSGATWTVTMGDGTVISSDNELDNEFTYCYGTSGLYDLELLYSTGSGPVCGSSIRIYASGGCFSVDSCYYTTCWDMVASCCALDTVKSITVVINGDTLTYNLTNHYHVTGNYQLIVDEILAVLDSLNWGGLFVSYLPYPNECFKEGDPNSLIPGFHFFNSAFPIVSLNGVKDCSGVWKDAEYFLDSENCD